MYQRQEAREAVRAEKRRLRHLQNQALEEKTQRLLRESGDQEKAKEQGAAPTPPAPNKDVFGTPAASKVNDSTIVKEQDNSVILSQVLQLMLKSEIALASEGKKGWYYRDASGTFQGPFNGKEMSEWYRLGYLPKDLKLSSSPTGESYSISAIVGDTNATAEETEEMFNTEIGPREVRQLRNNLAELIKIL